MNDQHLLTPAAMAGQLNEGGPVRGPKDEPGNGPRPKPQLSLWNAAQLLNGRERSTPSLPYMSCSRCFRSIRRDPVHWGITKHRTPYLSVLPAGNNVGSGYSARAEAPSSSGGPMNFARKRTTNSWRASGTPQV